MVVACNQSVAYRFQSGLQPLPAFNQLIRALMRFIERSTERVGDFFIFLWVNMPRTKPIPIEEQAESSSAYEPGNLWTVPPGRAV
jgi:hypothetical protein